MAANPGKDVRSQRKRGTMRNTFISERNRAAARTRYEAGVDRSKTGPVQSPAAAANALLTRDAPPPAPNIAQLSPYIPMMGAPTGPDYVTNYANTVTQQILAQQLQAAKTGTGVGPTQVTGKGPGAGPGGTFKSASDWYAPGTPDPEAFAAAVLKGLGAPANSNNMALLQGWFRAEGTSAKWNPLASTERMGGTGSINSVGVQNYGSMSAGVKATIRTLTNGRYNDIVKLMKKGINPIKLFRQAEDEFNVWRSGNPNAPGHYGLIKILKEMR